jgi:hypothetical protein
MTRCELATALLDEIERTRAQLERLRTAFVTRQEERTRGMDKCEECQRLWKAYHKATIQFVQLDEELRSITEDQGLEKLSGTRAEAAERLRVEARQRLAEHQAATGHR